MTQAGVSGATQSVAHRYIMESRSQARRKPADAARSEPPDLSQRKGRRVGDERLRRHHVAWEPNGPGQQAPQFMAFSSWIPTSIIPVRCGRLCPRTGLGGGIGRSSADGKFRRTAASSWAEARVKNCYMAAGFNALACVRQQGRAGAGRMGGGGRAADGSWQPVDITPLRQSTAMRKWVPDPAPPKLYPSLFDGLAP